MFHSENQKIKNEEKIRSSTDQLTDEFKPAKRINLGANLWREKTNYKVINQEGKKAGKRRKQRKENNI